MRNLQIILLLVPGILLVGCATSSPPKLNPTPTSEMLIPKVLDAEEVYKELRLCAEGNQSVEKTAETISFGLTITYQKVLPKIQLYIQQKNFSNIATKSYARYISSLAREEITKVLNKP